MEHADRRRWVEEISKINRRLNGEETTASTPIDWELVKQLGGWD